MLYTEGKDEKIKSLERKEIRRNGVWRLCALLGNPMREIEDTSEVLRVVEATYRVRRGNKVWADTPYQGKQLTFCGRLLRGHLVVIGGPDYVGPWEGTIGRVRRVDRGEGWQAAVVEVEIIKSDVVGQTGAWFWERGLRRARLLVEDEDGGE